MLLFLLLWLCQLSYGASTNGKTNGHVTSLRNRWYGPSYRPRWWDPDLSLRSGEFHYDGSDGPTTWAETFPDCGGYNQSPINVVTKNFKLRKTRKSLKWTNYGAVPRKMVVENSGHSIHVNGIWKNSTDIPYVTNGPLEKRYFFSQLHFHWGKNSGSGSEHTINGESYPLEMHVVHDRLIEDPTNLSEEGDSEHLVVVSYMFEIVKRDNPNLTAVLDATKEIQGDKKKKVYIKPFPIDNIVETFQGDYVTYKGSLTTPPCTEGVIWIISSKPLGISERQLATLRKSVRDHGGNTIRNYRPVQDLNGRNVYYITC